MIEKKSEIILDEIRLVFKKSDFKDLSRFSDGILSANKIVVLGAGRMGFAARGFAMRLKHLGLDAYMYGDSTVPNISSGDLLIVASGSGETPSIALLADIAYNNESSIGLITTNPLSKIAKLSSYVIKLGAPNKISNPCVISSQPMTTLMEQSTGIFFDALVLELMEKMNETHSTMWNRHSNLE